jgi:hypothetical protein
VREWDAQLGNLDAANAVLLVLTPDRPEPLAKAIEKHDLKSTLIPIDKSLWAEWGITNLDEDKLPYPSTFVVGPDGLVVFAETNENYKERTPPERVLAALTAINSGGDALLPAGAEPGVTKGPDWDGAFQVQTSTVEGGINIHIDVRDGFHIYGAKEEISRPLWVSVDGREDVEVFIPDGERKEMEFGVAWVITSEVDLLVPVEPPASGLLDVQLCTSGACSPPVTLPWSVQ